MPQLNIELPEPLLRLAALLGEVLGGPAAPVTSIDETLVTLALRRHFVGPLLYAAVSGDRFSIAPDLRQKLERSYQASVAARESTLKRLRQVAVEFGARGIQWMTIKGTIQAERLYSDPAWRESADIDILVNRPDFERALEALVDIGYIASNPPMPAPRPLRKAILGTVREVTLIASDDHRCAIELHCRLFLASDARTQSLHLKPAPGDLPAPALGAELACYLILHGAVSSWVRLKWLIDLVPLFAKLDGVECLAVPELARRMRVENSAAASLLLLRTLFPFAALDLLSPWLERKRSEPAVQKRVRSYAQMLSLERDWKSSPLDNARRSLEAQWRVFEAMSARMNILAFAPVSSAVRRFAGSLSRADRALTRSDVPP